MINLYYKLKNFFENNYFDKKYKNLEPKIYYDKKYDMYVNPLYINERGDIDYVCAETARGGCIYPYLIDNNHEHEHSISEVYLLAYNYPERFSISEQDKIYYSEQELNFINQLIKKGKYDISNYNNK